MMTLFKTEFRQLWPLAGLWLMLELLHTGLLVFTTRLDESEYSVLCNTFCEPGVNSNAVFIIVAIIVWVGWSLFPRDSDDGTLAHLQSLAVTRPQIFASKVVAGFALLASFYLFSSAVTYLFVWLNPQSIHGKYYAAMEWQHLLRHLAFSAIVLCHAVFLSSFRLVGLVLYAGYFVVVGWLESQMGNVGAWNLLNLLKVDFYGSELITDWSMYLFHGIVALVALWLGYLRWMRREASQAFGSIALNSPWLTVPFMAFLFIGLIGFVLQHSDKSVAQRNQNFGTLETQHYRFVYQQNAAPYAEELAAQADAMLERMADYLNTDPPPKVQTDLTANTSHVAGLAVHNRIRMRLRRFAQDTENQFVLAHETAHVFQSTVSQRRLKKVSASVGFFIEGMAQQVAFEIIPDERRRRLNWVVGAVAAKRHELNFEDLVDPKTFTEKFDAELPYTLGDLWVNTMTEVCGDDSLGKFLNIIGSKDSVLSLRGTAFWRQHLQRIPCELEDINFRFRERIETINESDEAKAIPITQSVNLRVDESNDDTIWMDVTVENPFEADEDGLPIAGKDYMLRVRSGASLTRGLDNTLSGFPQSQDEPNVVSFRLSKAQLNDNRFQYQIGYLGGYDYRTVFDEWQNATVPRR